MEVCKACQRTLDDQNFLVGETGFCSICARHILDWINDEVFAGIRERGEDPGIEVIEPDSYYHVQIEWFGTNQIHVEYTIYGEAYGPGAGRSEGIFSGLELAVQMDLTNRFNGIDMISYICCTTGTAISLNEVSQQW